MRGAAPRRRAARGGPAASYHARLSSPSCDASGYSWNGKNLMEKLTTAASSDLRKSSSAGTQRSATCSPAELGCGAGENGSLFFVLESQRGACVQPSTHRPCPWTAPARAPNFTATRIALTQLEPAKGRVSALGISLRAAVERVPSSCQKRPAARQSSPIGHGAELPDQGHIVSNVNEICDSYTMLALG